MRLKVSPVQAAGLAADGGYRPHQRGQGDQGGQDQGQAGQGGRAGEKRGILVSSFDSYAFEKITLNDITAKQAGRPFK